MREKSNTKRIRSFIAGLLALVLTLTPVLSSLPAIQASAADEEIWFAVSSGTGNGNGHAYSNAASSPAAALLHKDATMTTGQTLDMTFQMTSPSTSRFGIFYTYVDDDTWLYIGTNPDGNWYYQYKINGSESYPSLTLPGNNGEEMKFSATLNRETLSVTVNDVTVNVTNQVLTGFADKEAGRVGFRAGTYNGTDFTQFRFKDVKVGTETLSVGEDSWGFLCDLTGQTVEKEAPIPVYSVSGTVVDSENAPVSGAIVRIGTANSTTDAEGAYTITGIKAGAYDLSVSASGYQAKTQAITVTDGDIEVPAITLLPKSAVEYENYITSATGELSAAVSNTFPQVMQYKLADGEAERVMAGQESDLSIVKINGVSVAPEMGDVEIADDYAVYPMTLQDDGSNIHMTMTVKISVADNDLTWEVTDITKNEGCAKIHTIEVPNLNLVTISDDQVNAQFKGANTSGNTNASGDSEITFTSGFSANTSASYAYGFVSADGVSAGLWSNSEAAGDKRVMRNNTANTMSLTSAAWYYEYGNQNGADTYAGTPVSDLPCMKVCITGDQNEDDTVDWQDGAIAYRDIMNNPQGYEDVPELVNYRIVMNFSSQATNPFLKTADNIKKVYLATDGLGQAVMMKGYGSEGHDSANSEYGNIGERIGGAEDLKALNTIAHQYNTQTGIHVNAQEAYPEAQTFSDDLIEGPNSTGWGWLDQSYVIDKNYDLGTGLRYKRFMQLYDQLNGTSLYTPWPAVAQADDELPSAETVASTVAANADNDTDLDFIYLDVWYGDAWATRKVADEINNLGWRFTTEFGTTGEYDSTWQHWATEGSYGGASGKGINSDVIRFIRNHQKDSFILNWPSYGGTADNPLLGGFDLAGFEGWGSNNNFDEYTTRTFAVNLPTKFLQHYEVSKWVNYEDVGEESPVGNHEKEITLTNEDNDTVVVTRNEQVEYAAGTSNSNQFVERTITLNGKKVLDNVTYLLPWTDFETDEEKLYHYNYEGGKSTWDLQDGWNSLANVKVYKLTDDGRTDLQTINVVGGKLTLTAEANTAYVVLKGDDASTKTVTNFGEGTYVTDPGFNSYAGTNGGTALSNDSWTGDITDAGVKVERVVSGNKYLVMGSENKDLSISTEITGLTPGTNYVAQVYVDNKSDAKASIEVTGGTEAVSNYTLRSLAGNYVRCDAHNVNAVSASKMQLMLVSFTAETNTATLTLKREAGEDVTYFDDIRIVEKTLDNIKEDGSFEQDFESVTGGLYPFVMGPAQGVNDQVTHLSELHAPYTQSGWGNHVLDDVIEGNWSLKHHGSNTGLIYRTIPQNLHLDANVTYDVSFDYQAGCANSYYMVIGEGDDIIQTLDYLSKTAAASAGSKSTTQTYTFQVTGAESGQTWIGLGSTGASESGAYGQTDFVLDNLVVKEANMFLNKASIEMQGVGSVEKLEVVFLDGSTYEVEWTSSDETVATVDENGYVDAVGVGSATITATTKDEAVTSSSSGMVTVLNEKIAVQSGQFESVAANTEETTGEGANNGVASAIIDGDTSTFWHSQWSGTAFGVSEENPAILTATLKEDAEAFSGIQIVQRPSGTNGLIQKITYVIGDEFDAETNTVTGNVKTATVTLTNTGAGAVESIPLGETVNANYVQIRVLSGLNAFGAMGELRTYTSEVYTNLTEEVEEAKTTAAALAAAKSLTASAEAALDNAKEEQAGAVTELDKANAALRVANAELALQKAQKAEAEAEKVAKEAEKALAEAKAVKNAANADIKEREEAKASAAEDAAKAAEEAVAELTGNIQETEQKVTDAQDELDKVIKELNDAEIAELQAAANKAATAQATAQSKVNTAQTALNTAKANTAAAKTEYDKAVAAVAEAQAELALQKAQLEEAKARKASEEAKQALAQKQADVETDAAAKAALQKNADDAKAAAAQADAQAKNLEGTVIPATEKNIEALRAAIPTPGPTPPGDTQPVPEPVTTVVYKGVTYKVLSSAKKTAVAVKGTKKNVKSVVIPATVKIGGKSYKVVQIGSNAFKAYKKLTTLTIGKNVTTIGKNSFLNCSKLKKIVVKGTAVKSIKAGAFKKTARKITVTVPKKMTAKKRSSLKKLLRKGGISKNVKVK